MVFAFAHRICANRQSFTLSMNFAQQPMGENLCVLCTQLSFPAPYFSFSYFFLSNCLQHHILCSFIVWIFAFARFSSLSSCALLPAASECIVKYSILPLIYHRRRRQSSGRQSIHLIISSFGLIIFNDFSLRWIIIMKTLWRCHEVCAKMSAFCVEGGRDEIYGSYFSSQPNRQMTFNLRDYISFKAPFLFLCRRRCRLLRAFSVFILFCFVWI